MKNYWKKIICIGLTLSTGLLMAAEEEQPQMRRQWGNRDGRQGRNFRPMGGGMMVRLNKEAEIEAKFKAEYTAIVKQMIEAENKLAELAKKAKVELPADFNMVLRQLKLKYPAEFAVIRKKMQSRETMREAMTELAKLAEKENMRLPMFGMRPRRGGDGEERAPEPPKMRENPQAMIRKIKKEYPAEWEEYQKLRHEGKREEAQAKLRELMRKVNPPPKDAPLQK